MKTYNYNLDELDLEFVMSVQSELQITFGEKASDVLLESSFMNRLTEEPEYVYHFDESYWANVIKEEHLNKYDSH